jgi:transposase
LTRDHLSAISAITPDGRLYMMVQEETFKGPAIVRFLRHVLRHIPGKLLIIWDGLPAHPGQAVKDFLKQGAAQRIHLERLPGYAPDLNPDEGIWRYVNYVEMKNLCCFTLDHLRRELRKATARLRLKTDVIWACFKQVRLGVQV